MRQTPALRPLDVAVLLHLSLRPGETYGHLAAVLGVSKSTAHASVSRLLTSRLAQEVENGGIVAAAGPTREFLQFGAAYAFPPVTVPKARGVPTGFSVPSVQRARSWRSSSDANDKTSSRPRMGSWRSATR